VLPSRDSTTRSAAPTVKGNSRLLWSTCVCTMTVKLPLTLPAHTPTPAIAWLCRAKGSLCYQYGHCNLCCVEQCRCPTIACAIAMLRPCRACISHLLSLPALSVHRFHRATATAIQNLRAPLHRPQISRNCSFTLSLSTS
jgi:hypothetical protein